MLSREAKVGLFTLAVSAIVFWATFYIGKFDVVFGSKTYSAVLTSAHQLGVDSPVEVAGVNVGRITKVKILAGGRKAVIEFRLTDRDIAVYKDAEVSVFTTGFLGDRYVDLFPGTAEAGLLPEGEPIVNTNVPLGIEEMMAQMTPMIQDATGLLREMRALIGREEIQTGIPQMLDSLRHTALSMELVLSDYEKYVSKLIRKAADSVEIVADRLPGLIDKFEADFGGVGGVFEKISGAVTGTVNRFDDMSDLLEQSISDLQQILADINSGQGTVGALLKDQATADEIKEVVTQINRQLEKSNTLRIMVNYLGSYESTFGAAPQDGWRHRAEIQLRPSYDHYYSFGVVDRTEDTTSRSEREIVTESNGVVTSYTQTIRNTKNDLLFNAQIAKRFHDLTLRAGILESEGGVGMDYALAQDRLWLRAEAFDFGRSNDNPRLRSWAEARLFKHITLAVGAEDLAGRGGPRAMFGAGIFFTDQDLRHVLGAMPKVDF